MAIISIGGVAMPSPTSFKPPEYDLHSGDTGRDGTGTMHIERVRQGIHKINLEWKGITSSQLNTIKAAIKPASFYATFPTSGGNITCRMYAGDRNIELAIYNDGNIRWNMTLDLIEL
jgi:hypothetical protein